MADKDEKDDTEAEEPQEKKATSTMKIVILSVLLASVISGGMVGVTIFLISGDNSEQVADAEADEEGEAEDEEEDEIVEPPIYHGMSPKFVVSFSDQRIARFMQFSLQIMTRDEEVINQITMHNPAIRSSLLLLFDNQTAEVMKTREGKEQLLNLIMEDINTTLESLAEISGVEAAYFDSFLIQ